MAQKPKAIELVEGIANQFDELELLMYRVQSTVNTLKTDATKLEFVAQLESIHFILSKMLKEINEIYDKIDVKITDN